MVTMCLALAVASAAAFFVPASRCSELARARNARACITPPDRPVRRTGAASDTPGSHDPDDPDDPVNRPELWLRREEVRYGDAGAGAGFAYCSAYGRWDGDRVVGDNSRVVVLLESELARCGEEALRLLADRIALSCECVALVPLLRGGANRWPHSRLADEAWAACTYANAALGAQGLALLALGAAARPTVELLAAEALAARAAVVVDAGGAGAGAAARDVRALLLGLCSGPASGAAAAELRNALGRNPHLGADQYVVDFDGAPPDFALAPAGGVAAEGEAARAIALVQAWVDRFVPDGR